MRMTKNENLFYLRRVDELGLTINNVLNKLPDRRGFRTEICKNLDIDRSSFTNTFNGKCVNNRILVRVHEYLTGTKEKVFLDWAVNLTKAEKTVDSLLMNNFSYWEAVRIAHD